MDMGCTIITGMCADSKDESEFIPSTIIIRFVDADAGNKKADDKNERRYKSMPIPAEKPRRSCIGFLVFGV